MKELSENGKTERLSAGSEELFPKIFNYSNDAIFVIDPAHDRILDVNPKACSLLGYSREELLSIPVSAVHPKEMPQLLAFAESVFEQGHGWTNEFTCLTKTGQHLPAEISAALIEVAGRRCLVALVRDISDRKRAEEALKQYSENLERLVEERTDQLRRSEERQRLLLEINNAVIANLDRQSLFHAITQALKKVFSFDAAGICVKDPEKGTFRLFALETPALPPLPI
jgi:PAS domain S-box-containing protein